MAGRFPMNDRLVRAGLIARVDLARAPDFALGDAQVRPARREIAADGSVETVEPRVMRVLVALARANGEVLSRGDLIESCWDGVIVGEDAINRCIGRLRRAAEATGNAFSIETMPRVGYRLITVEAGALATDADESVATGPGSAIPGPTHAPAAPAFLPTISRRAGVLTAAALALFLAGYSVWWFWPRPPAAPAEPDTSVAVLPFVNMSGNPAQEYFSDGFSEELLNDLSGDARLRVAARTSAFAFKGKTGDTQAIAHTLHVHHIVEGSVREMGDRVRITAQLIDAGDGYSIWSASYDRNLADILSVQGDVARAVAAALTHRIIPVAPRSPMIDPAAYRLYLRGRQDLDLVSPEGYTKAYPLLKEVTAKEPHFAEGLAAFSHAAWGYSQFDPLHKDAIRAEAKDAAAKALLLDPRNIKARALQGVFDLDEWNWKAAASDFRILRAEAPNNMRALANLGVYYDTMGIPDAAVAVMRRWLQVDPLSDAARRFMFLELSKAHRYREAIVMVRTILADHPDDPWGLVTLCEGDAHTNQIGEAHQVDDRLRRLKSDQADYCQFDIDVNSGDVGDARAILAHWSAGYPDRFLFASDIAEKYITLNDFEKASDWLERAYDRRETGVFEPAFEADYASYRKTARWQAVTQRAGFKEWQAVHNRIAAELAARGGAP